MDQAKYVMETGLASDLNPVIKCSPEMYNLLIQEIDDLFEQLIMNGPAAEKYTRIRRVCKLYPALAVLRGMPKLSEIVKSN